MARSIFELLFRVEDEKLLVKEGIDSLILGFSEQEWIDKIINYILDRPGLGEYSVKLVYSKFEENWNSRGFWVFSFFILGEYCAFLTLEQKKFVLLTYLKLY